jgi:adenylate cyclase
MASEGATRRLVAIVAADVAGYTRQVEEDTDGTVAAWQVARAGIIDPTIAGHSGRVVKLTGDGFLAEFATVQDAVKCAIIMQEGLGASLLNFRMGVNLGDTVDDDKDIHGEGVNIAARLEGLAELGGICISGDVYNQVRNKMTCRFEDLGEQSVKHVSAPVRVYRVVIEDETVSQPGTQSEVLQDQPLALPVKPSIAVLPFDNMSGDPEQEYFSDGIAEDIITALSRFNWFFVIARNSSFSYKGTSPDVRHVARDLGA